MRLGVAKCQIDKKKLLEILDKLGKEVKQEISKDYKNGYIEGLMDYYNEINKVIGDK